MAPSGERRPSTGRWSTLKAGFGNLMSPLPSTAPDLDRAGEQELLRYAAPLWEAQRDYLADRSALYRRLLGDAGIRLRDVGGLDTLPGLPFTTKDDLRQSQEAAPPLGRHLAARPADVGRVYRTSGTTGEPLWVAVTPADADHWTRFGVACYRTVGITERSRVLTTIGAGPYVAGHTHHTLAEIGCRVVPVAPADTAGTLAALRAGLADTLLTTPSFALHLAAAAGDGANRLGLDLIVTGAEPGGGVEPVRRRIADAFGARVAEVLGMAEIGPSLFGECGQGLGMHFTARSGVWLEMVDAAGEPMPLHMGAEGELVYTTLAREAMPLVRYRSGDVATVVTTNCKCRRASPAIRVVGRRDDMFIVRGVNVFPLAVQEVVAGFATVTGRSRVVLPAGAVAVEPPVAVEVEIADGASALRAADIAAAIHERLNFRADVRLVPLGEFGPAGYKSPAVRRS